MTLKILKHSDLILHTPCQTVDFNDPGFDIEQSLADMSVLMLKNNGLGLAANQVGLNKAFFIMRGTEKSIAIFNPRIVALSDDMIDLDEGCLSYPGFFVNIRRHRHVRLRFENQFGETTTELYTGMTARVVQHEIRHLLGECPFKDVSRLKIDRALKKSSKQGYQYFHRDFI